ncbi:MAG: glycogen synthase GlgA [Candidatus Saganbacteria bacterium]|nr:glycogen synthase GlgA [Candidatus Saganbacteria bacterium]
MKILVVSSEMAPFSKTGGLADVIGALPKSLKKIGHDVRVIIPKYKMTDKGGFITHPLMKDISVEIGQKKYKFDLFETKLPGSDVTVYLVGCDEYFDRDGLYQENGKDYPDNAERFLFFCKAVLISLKSMGWEPNVVHCNDWQSAFVAAFIKTIYAKDPFFNTIATVYTIHNMGYLGLFAADKMPLTGLGWEYFTPDLLEFWGNLCFAKAGLVYADVIGTVSETYSKEIALPEFGCGLDGLIRSRKDDIYGIVNGIDYEVWDPEKDKDITSNYSSSNLRGKASDKAALRKNLGLKNENGPAVIGMVTRMADQKGFDLLSGIFTKMMSLPVQFVLLGTGEPKYEKQFLAFAKKYQGKVSANIGFDSAAAPPIYAGSDMFLMPSSYEPCGLGQLISFKYGTVPIVRKTGGLADTVIDYDPLTEEGSGFVFADYSCDGLFDAVKRAVSLYVSDKKKWTSLVKKIMKYDFSWDSSAKNYINLYKKAIENLSVKNH